MFWSFEVEKPLLDMTGRVSCLRIQHLDKVCLKIQHWDKVSNPKTLTPGSDTLPIQEFVTFTYLQKHRKFVDFVPMFYYKQVLKDNH